MVMISAAKCVVYREHKAQAPQPPQLTCISRFKSSLVCWTRQRDLESWSKVRKHMPRYLCTNDGCKCCLDLWNGATQKCHIKGHLSCRCHDCQTDTAVLPLQSCKNRAIICLTSTKLRLQLNVWQDICRWTGSQSNA